MSELDLYISLFITFFKIGLFGFGGGYAMLSLIQHDVVETHNWISVADFTDIVAISQSTPGPIAFNTATYIGYTATGSIWGSAICTNSCQPSFPDHHDHDLQVLLHVPGQQIRGNGHARFKNHCFRTYRGSSIVIDEQAKLRGLQKLYHLRHSLHCHLSNLKWTRYS